MSRMLRNLPIRQKLSFITMLASGVALVVSGAGFMAYDQYAFKRDLAARQVTIAEMIGYNSASALSFNDPVSAGQTLMALRARPDVSMARIYTASGEAFATYQRDDLPVVAAHPPAAEMSGFGSNYFEVSRPIIFDGELLGSIQLRVDLTELRARQQSYTLIVVLVGIGSIFAAFGVASRLHRIIVVPIARLSDAAHRVATDRDYTIRVERSGDDELGRLTDAFNGMLAQIESRDAALQSAHDELENRVAERTSELAYERDLLRALLEASPDSIYFKDRESRFVLISRSKMEETLRRVPGLRGRLLGPEAAPDAPVEARLFAGLSDADIYMEEAAANARRDEQEIMRTGRPLVGHTERQTFLDGTMAWSLTNKMPWRDRDGAVIGTFGISKDITDLKNAEEQLEQVHRKLVDTSRAAGMAEVATGVLHNVGNVLNSVNVSATLVAETVRNSKVVNLGKLNALLAEHHDDLGGFLSSDPRGRMVRPYLGTLAEELVREQQSMLGEIDQLRKNVDHIKDIVAMQQNYAKTSGLVEAVSIPDLVEDAIRMNAGSLARHGVSVVRDYSSRPVVAVDKHKVLQILINLIRNAKYACDESGRPDKRITISTALTESSVGITVMDNGVGIPAANLTRVFNHGFTTRENGHGFGLHSGALAAREMGGSLEVRSDGPGRGATFTLTLPLKPENTAHEQSAA